MTTVAAIAAMSENRVIGRDNVLPWNVPEDMQRFMTLTKGHIVIMGRKTYDSLPKHRKPLPDRVNVVLSRDKSWRPAADVQIRHDPLDAVKEFCAQASSNQIVWIIGGEEIYSQTLPLIEIIELTLIEGEYEGDTFFPPFESDFRIVSSERRKGFSYQRYQRKKNENNC